MRAPTVLIELSVEAAPRILLDCGNESEERRLWDWVLAHDELADLVARAFEIANEKRAA